MIQSIKFHKTANLILERYPDHRPKKLFRDITHYFNAAGDELFFYNSSTSNIKVFDAPRKWDKSTDKDYVFFIGKGEFKANLQDGF